MQFYIYENGTWNETYVEIAPQLTLAFDTTNDSLQCSLMANTRQEPYKPMTAFKIVDDENNVKIMWIVSDAVSVFSTSPQSYKHELNIVQYRYFLNKHILRNTVANQPRKKLGQLYGAVSNYVDYDDDTLSFAIREDGNGESIMWTDTLNIGRKTKIKSGSYFIKLYGTIIDDVANTKFTNLITSLTSEDDHEYIKANAKFRIMNGSTVVLDNLYIKDFNKRVYLTTSQISTLNTYLSSNSNVSLTVKIYGTGNKFNRSFAYIENYLGTYSNLTAQIYIDLDLYNYTMYDLLDTLLKQYRLKNSSGYKRDLLFNLPNSGELYDLLTTTYPADTVTFTQATWYEVLTEIFRYYDAGFTFDENKVLQIEYYNDPKTKITPKKNVSLSQNDKNYSNGRVAFYQNAVNEFVTNNVPTRSEQLGVPGKSDYGIVLPFPIYQINKIEYLCTFSASLPYTSGIANANKVNFSNRMALDLTYFIVSRQEWTLLNTSSSLTGAISSLKQMGTIPFERGSKFISMSNYAKNYNTWEKPVLENVLKGAISRFFGIPDWNGQYSITSGSTSPADTTYANQRFNVEYLVQNDGRMQTETLNNKYLGEFLNNQSSGAVDLNKLGLNMLGESLKDGEPTMTASCQFTKWEDRPKEGDYIVDNQGNYWIANVVNYKIHNDFIESTIEFSKNFNALSLRVVSDKQSRLTAISSELAQKSEDNFIDYIYVSPDNAAPETRHAIAMKVTSLTSLVGQTFGGDENNYTIKNIDTCAISTTTNSRLFIPLIKYGAGNCICFEMQYDDAKNAGNQLITGTGWFGSDTFFSQVTPYADVEGWADKLSIDFLSQETSSILATASFPQLTYSNSSTTFYNIGGEITQLEYYKKPNEIFALNYQLCFLPLPEQKNNFFIGSAFINENFFTRPEKVKTKKFYLYYTETGNFYYSILDTKGVMGAALTREPVTVATRMTTNNYFTLSFLTTNEIHAKTWAICDEEGNIYFACNYTKYFSSVLEDTETIYFSTRSTRMQDDDEVDTLQFPDISGGFTFQVGSNQWQYRPANYKRDITQHFTGAIPDQPMVNSITKSYTVQMSVDPTNVTISSSPYGTNTVSWTRINLGEVQFTYTIYGWDDRGDGGTGLVEAAIYWSYSGQTAYYMFNYSFTLPELKGLLMNVTITPDETLSGYTNTVNFNSSSGTISGTVYSSTSGYKTFTITYEPQ